MCDCHSNIGGVDRWGRGEDPCKLGAAITQDVTAVGVMVTLTLVEWTGGQGGTPLQTWSCDY